MDSASGENKNNTVLRFMAYIQSTGKVLGADLAFLVTGHTHEDVDKLVAMFLLLVLRPKVWEMPDQMNQLIKDALCPLIKPKDEELAAEKALERWLRAWKRKPARPGSVLAEEGDRAGGPRTPRRARRALCSGACPGRGSSVGRALGATSEWQ